MADGADLQAADPNLYRMTIADSAFVFLLASFLLETVRRPSHDDMLVKSIAEVLPSVSWDNPLIAAMAEPAEDFLTWNSEDRFRAAHFDAQRALVSFAAARGGYALERFRDHNAKEES